MHSIGFIALVLISSSALANVWNCPVNDETKPSNWPDERIVAEFNKRLESITYIHQIPNNDGTFTEKPETLYSLQNHIRGGFPIAFCGSDQGHIAMELGMVNWTSKCSTQDNQNPLLFKADMYADRNGSVQVQILDLQGGNDISQLIPISVCK